jgi:UDP-GlcNAc3NAcA epimerase
VKILSVVGARPEFIQAAPVSRAIRQQHEEILVHTGQHYDYAMSQAFFDELDLPAPDYNLEVGSGSHASQTGEMLVRLEEVMLRERPDVVIVRGDTNSTLSAALAASKLHIPIVHIEAGERSFDRATPEEINRIVADRLSDVHLCTSRSAVAQLAAEGIRQSVHWTGDVMLDATLSNTAIALERSTALERLDLRPGQYVLATVHRAVNTDVTENLQQILEAFSASTETVVFPIHPRTCAAIQRLQIASGSNVKLINPVGYLDMLLLEKHARLIATDSGGVQREAYFLGVPSLTLREQTEWKEIVEAGWSVLVGSNADRILKHWTTFSPRAERPPIFGDGHASQRIAAVIDGLSS